MTAMKRELGGIDFFIFIFYHYWQGFHYAQRIHEYGDLIFALSSLALVNTWTSKHSCSQMHKQDRLPRPNVQIEPSFTRRQQPK